jgi:hypothetical protein
MAWYNSNAKKPDYKLSEEAGRDAVLELISFYEIKFDEEPDKDFDKLMNQLAGYYRMGLLENKQDEKSGFCVVQHLTGGKDITYREMKGKDRLVHAKYDAKTQTDEKVDALLGKLSGFGADIITDLKGDDRRAAVLVAALFFGV